MSESRPRYARNAGAVSRLKDHLVWCPKSRRAVLTPPVNARLKQVIHDIASEYDFIVHTMEVMPDHVHLFVACDPTRSVAEIVNRFKGTTSRLLRDEVPHLRSRLPTLWSRSSYAGTVGHVSDATVRRSIESQKGQQMLLSYKYRIEPNKTQAAALGDMLGDFCALYNAALQQCFEAYRRRGVCLRYGSQAGELRAVRACHDGLARWSYSTEQQVLRRLDKSYKAFFQRDRGLPRFRPRRRFHAAEFRVGDGLTLRKSGKIGLVGVAGEIKVRWHRVLPSEPKCAILTRQCGKWCVVCHVEVEPAAANDNAASIGVDFGLTSLMALSNGDTVSRPNWTKRATRELRRRQRAIARCKRGSTVRAKRVAAKARFQARVAAKRRDLCHKLSRDLVGGYGRIAIEDLNIKGLAKGMHAKHVHDAAWAQIAATLEYKAAKAGTVLAKVDPRGTSQTCPECRLIAPKTLATREHRCQCGCALDRDVAAAMVVHFRAFGFWPGTGRGQSSEPVAAKL